MSYSGLVSREYSSGNRIQRGGITKTGNGHLRRVLVEAAWAYQHKPWVGGFLLKRQQGLDQKIKDIAWKAQWRFVCPLQKTGSSRQKQTTDYYRHRSRVAGLCLGDRRRNRKSTAAASCPRKTLCTVCKQHRRQAWGSRPGESSSVLCDTASRPNSRPQSEAAPDGSRLCGSDPRILE